MAGESGDRLIVDELLPMADGDRFFLLFGDRLYGPGFLALGEDFRWTLTWVGVRHLLADCFFGDNFASLSLSCVLWK